MNKPALLLSLLAFMLPSLNLAQASSTPVRVYMAPLHEAEWQASEDEGQCQLEHEIPGIGETKLAQSRSQSLSFELHVTQDINLGNLCQVEINPPPWRHGVPSQSLGTIKLVPDAKHLMATGGAAQKIFQALESGMMASFSCQSQAKPLSRVRVVISPVRYLIALPDFQECATQLSKKKPATKTSASKSKAKKKAKPKASKAKSKSKKKS